MAAVVTRSVRQVSPPVPLTSRVVKGFGRGSKMLGIPTANVDMAAVSEAGAALDAGALRARARARGA